MRCAALKLKLTFDAERTQLRKVVVVQVRIDAEQPPHNRLYRRLEVLRERHACAPIAMSATASASHRMWDRCRWSRSRITLACNFPRAARRIATEDAIAGHDRAGKAGRTDLAGENGLVVEHPLDPVHELVDVFCASQK